MADLGVVKSNVSKMVSMGAPESDIDSYIQAEGITVDAVKNFQAQSTSPQESISAMLARNAGNAWNESGGAILSAANDLTANNIKPNVARIAGQPMADAIFPEQKTLEGKALRVGAGFAVPAAKVVEGLGVLKGGALVGAAYGAGQDVLNPNTTLQQREGNAAAGAGLGLATAGAIKAAPVVLNKVLDMVPQPVKDRIFNLYNSSIGAKIKNLSDAAKIRDSRINMVKTVSDNLPNVQFSNPTAQERGIPQNRADNLEAFQQTKDNIWQQHLADTQGATAQGVQVDYPKVVDEALNEAKAKIGNKSLGLDAQGKPIPNANTGLNDAFNKIAEEQKALGNMTPSEAVQHLKMLNDQIKPLYKSGNAVDFSTKDLLSSIRYKLSDATDNAIEDALGKSGFSDQRKSFSDVRAAEKEIVNSANKYYREQGGQGGITHPIVDLWSLKDLLQSGGHVLTGNPVGAVTSLGQAVAVKAASKLSDFLKSPNRKIVKMYELAKQYIPKSSNPPLNGTYIPPGGPGGFQGPSVLPSTSGLPAPKAANPYAKGLPSPRMTSGQVASPEIQQPFTPQGPGLPAPKVRPTIQQPITPEVIYQRGAINKTITDQTNPTNKAIEAEYQARLQALKDARKIAYMKATARGGK